jgi:hypothetical protein
MVKIQAICEDCGTITDDDTDNPYVLYCSKCGSRNTTLTFESIMLIGRNVKCLFPKERVKKLKFVNMGFKADFIRSHGTKKEFKEANAITVESIKYYRNMAVIPSFNTLDEAEAKAVELSKNLDSWIVVRYRNVISNNDLYLLDFYKDDRYAHCYNEVANRVKTWYGKNINLDGYCYVLYSTE